MKSTAAIKSKMIQVTLAKVTGISGLNKTARIIIAISQPFFFDFPAKKAK